MKGEESIVISSFQGPCFEPRLRPQDILKVKMKSLTTDSLQLHGVQPSRLFLPWDFPVKSPGVGCHFLPQGIFTTQGLNLGLPHCRQVLYHLSHQGNILYMLNSWCFVLSKEHWRTQTFSMVFSQCQGKHMSMYR